MESEQIEKSIEEAQNDITSLGNEIEVLEVEYERMEGMIGPLETEIQRLREGSREKLKEGGGEGGGGNGGGNGKGGTKGGAKGDRNEDFLIPPIVKHSYFDESISQYFDLEVSETSQDTNTNTNTNPNTIHKHNPQKRTRIDDITNKMAQKSMKIVDSRQNILYENMFRLGGITFFPINKFALQGLEVLGIRFDNYSHYSHKFSSPHYVILKRVEVEVKLEPATFQSKWDIHRDTLPSFVVVEELALSTLGQEGTLSQDKVLSQFVELVRDKLIAWQFKKDVFEEVNDLVYSDLGLNMGIDRDRHIIHRIEKDIAYERVKIFIKNRNGINKLSLFIIETKDSSIINATYIDDDNELSQSLKDIILSIELSLKACTIDKFSLQFKRGLSVLIDKKVV